MHARSLIVQAQAGKVDEFVRVLRDAVLPPVRAQKGFKGAMVLTDRDASKIIAFSLWETEADARAMEKTGSVFRAQAGRFKDIITGVPANPILEVSYQE